MHEFTHANRIGWDGLAAIHYRTYHIEKLLKGEPLINEVIRSEVSDVRGKSLVHLLCHIGTDTLSWALLGAQVTGIDISPESLKYARILADRMKIDARFVESDILDVMDKVNEKFDIVFSSTGVLCWLPDINRYALTVRHLLQDGGFFYIFDGHPFRNMLLDADGNPTPGTFEGDYFNTKAWHYNGLGDYTDPEVLIPSPSYEWTWTLGEVVTAFCEAGLRIEFLHEYPRYFYSGYTPSDGESDRVERFPCVFSLKATTG